MRNAVLLGALAIFVSACRLGSVGLGPNESSGSLKDTNSEIQQYVDNFITLNKASASRIVRGGASDTKELTSYFDSMTIVDTKNNPLSFSSFTVSEKEIIISLWRSNKIAEISRQIKDDYFYLELIRSDNEAFKEVFGDAARQVGPLSDQIATYSQLVGKRQLEITPRQSLGKKGAGAWTH